MKDVSFKIFVVSFILFFISLGIIIYTVTQSRFLFKASVWYVLFLLLLHSINTILIIAKRRQQ